MSLDETILEQLDLVASASGSSGLVARLVVLFLEDTVERLEKLRTAVERDDRDAVRALAHAIRGGAATLVAYQLVQNCAELDEAPDDWTSTDVGSRVSALSAAFDQAQVALEQLRV